MLVEIHGWVTPPPSPKCCTTKKRKLATYTIKKYNNPLANFLDKVNIILF
jgi:hypothetical protein